MSSFHPLQRINTESTELPIKILVIGIYYTTSSTESFLFGEGKNIAHKTQLEVMAININEIDQTNIILNCIYITYAVLLGLSLPNVRRAPTISEKTNKDAKTEALFE